MDEKSQSVSHGDPAGREHNIVAEYRAQLENVDPSRTHLNVIVVDETIEDFYDRVFGGAVEAYNAQQEGKNRPERAIGNYLEKIRGGKQEKPAYECVIQIGNRGTNTATDEACRDVSEAVYLDFVGWWRRNLPQFKIHQCVVHMDEATPHLHVAYVPVSEGNRRGLETKNSLRGAMKAMGYSDIRDVNRLMFEGLEECARAHGVERLDMGIRRGREIVRDFKQLEHDMRREDYPYDNDPRLLGIVGELASVSFCQMEVIEEQAEQIQGILNAPKRGIGRMSALDKAAKSMAEANAELESRVKGIRERLESVRDALAEVPTFWRDHVLNPVSDRLRSLVRGEVAERGEREPMRPYDPFEGLGLDEFYRAVNDIDPYEQQSRNGWDR